ncbi:hypothetical protein NUW54_g12521 [Trametes sanguinea]|uniref:Uncharacterized protein n=1 Tax=Trametes sanguinea TaxID=158606 RepID=A0ACC1MWG2_9APHY|nr:hypothetical protein NUW54_g12521 [Trametes sanguinea]
MPAAAKTRTTTSRITRTASSTKSSNTPSPVSPDDLADKLPTNLSTSDLKGKAKDTVGRISQERKANAMRAANSAPKSLSAVAESCRKASQSKSNRLSIPNLSPSPRRRFERLPLLGARALMSASSCDCTENKCDVALASRNLLLVTTQARARRDSTISKDNECQHTPSTAAPALPLRSCTTAITGATPPCQRQTRSSRCAVAVSVRALLSPRGGFSRFARSALCRSRGFWLIVLRCSMPALNTGPRCEEYLATFWCQSTMFSMATGVFLSATSTAHLFPRPALHHCSYHNTRPIWKKSFLTYTECPVGAPSGFGDARRLTPFQAAFDFARGVVIRTPYLVVRARLLLSMQTPPRLSWD